MRQEQEDRRRSIPVRCLTTGTPLPLLLQKQLHPFSLGDKSPSRRRRLGVRLFDGVGQSSCRLSGNVLDGFASLRASWRAPTDLRRAPPRATSSSKSSCRAGSGAFLGPEPNRVPHPPPRDQSSGNLERASPPWRLISCFSASPASLAPLCLASSHPGAVPPRHQLVQLPEVADHGLGRMHRARPAEVLNFLRFLDLSPGGCPFYFHRQCSLCIYRSHLMTRVHSSNSAAGA